MIQLVLKYASYETEKLLFVIQKAASQRRVSGKLRAKEQS